MINDKQLKILTKGTVDEIEKLIREELRMGSINQIMSCVESHRRITDAQYSHIHGFCVGLGLT